MDEQMSPDLLSNLPLGIIHDILSLVPIKEAIGTSLLSKQWRFIWTSLPNIVFYFRNESEINRLVRFISHVLLLHEGPVHKLELHLPLTTVSKEQFQCFNHKLFFLSWNDIRILVLKFFNLDPWIEMQSSLYSCQNLTRLELRVNAIPPPPPSFKGFLFLRSLEICERNVDCSTIERIVARSPLLEELRLTGERHSEMTIRAPNLKILIFVYDSTHLSLCTPLLEELEVFSDYIKLSFHEFSVFTYLRIIRLYDVFFERTEEIMAVNNLIKCSPNLQKLEIATYTPDTLELASATFWDTKPAPDFTYDSLKVIDIEMNFHGCGINEMKLVKFLLARSPALERMRCSLHSNLSKQVALNLKDELLTCPRASANAKIVIQ